jgi:hypothetical protein
VQAVRWVGAAAGLLLVLATVNSVFRTLVVPRGVSSRVSILVARAVKATYRTAAGRLPEYEQRDALLASQAPATLLAQLLMWVVLLITGFGLMMWPLRSGGLAGALRESGSSFLTLGFASTDRPVTTVLSFAAAALGLVVVALQVGYLPTLYSAFNRRETLVTRLQSRAGEPAWGPEILARHQLVGTVDNLPLLYDDWETWAADVAESHSNYPALVYFRSPRPLRSWVVGLLAVLDSAALYLACCPSTAPSEARLALRMGFTCLRDIATTLGLTFDPDPRPDAPIELTYDEFLAGIARMSASGFELERSPEEAWPHFRGWRVNYERIAYELADRVDAVPAPWSGPRRGKQAPIAIRRPVNRVPEAPDEDYSLPQVGDRQRRTARAMRRR